MQVRHYMTAAAAVTHPDEPVVAAARLMRQRSIGALPVCSQDGRLRGMVTDRDIVVRCVAAGDDPERTRVAEIMTRRVLAAEPDRSVEEAARKTGRSVSLVRRRLKVAAIDDDMRSHVGAAQLSIEDWETIADYEAWPDLQERLAKAAGGRNWNMAVREAKTERKWREWLASARATLAGLDIEPIEEEPSETGRYSRPEGLRALERHTSGDIGEAVAEWREEFGNDPVVGIRALTWGRAVVFYREVDEQAEAEAKREREERFAAEREERERAEAPARGFADASR